MSTSTQATTCETEQKGESAKLVYLTYGAYSTGKGVGGMTSPIKDIKGRKQFEFSGKYGYSLELKYKNLTQDDVVVIDYKSSDEDVVRADKEGYYNFELFGKKTGKAVVTITFKNKETGEIQTEELNIRVLPKER